MSGDICTRRSLYGENGKKTLLYFVSHVFKIKTFTKEIGRFECFTTEKNSKDMKRIRQVICFFSVTHVFKIKYLHT